jgi:sugar phosphate isomerase/epimerase
MSFVYCLNTSTIQPVPLLEKIRLAGKHGFAAIELWLNDVFAYLEAGGPLSDVIKAVADAGLYVPCMIAMKGWGDASNAEYPTALEECRRRMDLAARLGARYVVATPPRGKADLAVVSQRYRDLLAIGREIGVQPAMEYLGFCESVYRVDQAWQIVQEAETPEATLVLDAFHTFRGGSSQDDVEKIPISRIANYHLDDAPATPPREQQMDPDRVLPGEGILDLGREMRWLRDHGYTGTISLELFNPTLWSQSPDDVLQRGMQWMRELLE